MDQTLDDIGLVLNALGDAQAIIQPNDGGRELLKKQSRNAFNEYVFGAMI